MTDPIPTPDEVLSSIDRARPTIGADPTKALDAIHAYGRSQFLDGYERARATDNVRTLFALRAPTDVPEWFEPVLHARAPKQPVTEWTPSGDARHDALLSDLQQKSDEDLAKLQHGSPGDVGPQIATYVLDQRRYLSACDAWQARNIQERFAQWPWFWADRIIAAEGTGAVRLASVGELMRTLEPKITFSGPAGDPRVSPSATPAATRSTLIDPKPGDLLHCVNPQCAFDGTAAEYKPGSDAHSMACPVCGTEQRNPFVR